MDNPRLDEHGFPVKQAFPNVHDIYNREAKPYDSAMVERWKTAMEGLLIFAGLFSAAVTAFIIEGYKSLKPDSGDITVELLYQLSQQMALAANGEQFPLSALLPPPSQIPFSPAWTAVAANILWFISLGLSLACAVAATLVQQWARNYVHTIERRPSAERRARMRMYLFKGVERFKMSQIIDGVPALLHLALFTFLLGLVFFIQTINWSVTAIAIAIFATSVATYLYATFLPLVAPDSPIQTPLTNVVWRASVIRQLHRISARVRRAREAATLIFGRVLRHIQQHLRRYFQALVAVWTVVDLLVRHLHSRLSDMTAALTLPLHRPPSGAFHDTELLSTPSISDFSLVPSSISDLSSILYPPPSDPLSYASLGNLDAARAFVARDTTTEAFKNREKEAFTWLVECLDEDREILPFMEAMPAFVQQAAFGHDARGTFSHIFCHTRLRLYTRLPDFLRRHDENARIQAAFAQFHLCVEEKDWSNILSTLVTPEDLWPRGPPWWNILHASPPNTRVQLLSMQSTIDFSWLSTRHQWSSIARFFPWDADSWWPVTFSSSWNRMIKIVDISQPGFPPQIPSYLLPTLSFAKALLNLMLADNYSTVQYSIERILRDYLPFSLSWFSESSTAEEQRAYCAVLATIVSALEARWGKFDRYFIASAIGPFASQSRRLSDRVALRGLDQVLQSKIWDQMTITFQSIVKAHIDKSDEAGCAVLSPEVITKHRIVSIASASNQGEIILLTESLNLRHMAADMQWRFINTIESFRYSNDLQQSAIDPETGIDQAVLIFEAAIDVIYTLDDLDALQDAEDLVSWFLEPEHYPYNECALACRDYLLSTIRQRGLLDSVYDHTTTVVGADVQEMRAYRPPWLPELPLDYR